jgi:hypothetical protein
MALCGYLVYLGFVLMTLLNTAHGDSSTDSKECSCCVLIYWENNRGNTSVFPDDDPNKIYLKYLTDICGDNSTIYPQEDVQSCVATWVAPLFVLIGTMQLHRLVW